MNGFGGVRPSVASCGWHRPPVDGGFSAPARSRRPQERPQDQRSGRGLMATRRASSRPRARWRGIRAEGHRGAVAMRSRPQYWRGGGTASGDGCRRAAGSRRQADRHCPGGPGPALGWGRRRLPVTTYGAKGRLLLRLGPLRARPAYRTTRAKQYPAPRMVAAPKAARVIRLLTVGWSFCTALTHRTPPGPCAASAR